MPDPAPLAIAKAFAALCAAAAGVKSAYHYMPEEYAGLPAVAMTWTRVQQDDVYTGPATENLWQWTVDVVVPIGGRVAGSDFQQAQESLYSLVPAILAVQRQNPDLGGLAIKTAIGDLGEEPAIDADAGTITKALVYTAWSAEV